MPTNMHKKSDVIPCICTLCSESYLTSPQCALRFRGVEQWEGEIRLCAIREKLQASIQIDYKIYPPPPHIAACLFKSTFLLMALLIDGYLIINTEHADRVQQNTYIQKFPFSLIRNPKTSFSLRIVSLSAEISSKFKHTIFLGSKALGKTALFGASQSLSTSDSSAPRTCPVLASFTPRPIYPEQASSNKYLQLDSFSIVHSSQFGGLAGQLDFTLLDCTGQPLLVDKDILGNFAVTFGIVQ